MTWQQKLLQWYQKHKRDLPWRRSKDPYAIWISEIMLQQTTVETVIPYYEKFLKKFPTIISLSESSEEEVVGLWSGLGYYSRARNLHKAARMLNPPQSPFVKGGGGKDCPPLKKGGKGGFFPFTVETLLKLPGIGRYTAGAIASIAFDIRAPIVDGNVIRVLSRLFRIDQDPKSTEGQKIFWKMAEEILPQKKCGDFNQALMELGATVCFPKNPLCLLCPVRVSCQALKEGKAEDYPKGKKKVMYENVSLSAVVIQRAESILLVQRGQQKFLKKMWELPMVEGGVSLLQEQGFSIRQKLPAIKHSVLNRRLTITPYLADFRKKISPQKNNKNMKWVAKEDVETLPMSSMNKKILKLIGSRKISSD